MNQHPSLIVNHHQPQSRIIEQHQNPLQNEYSLPGFGDEFLELPTESFEHYPSDSIHWPTNEQSDKQSIEDKLKLFVQARQRGDNKINPSIRDFIDQYKKREVERIITCLESNPVHLCYIEFNIIINTLDQYCQGALDYFIDRQSISFIYEDGQKTTMPFEVSKNILISS